MGFFGPFLGYLACLCVAVITIAKSLAFMFPAPPVTHQSTVEVGAQKNSKPAQKSSKRTAYTIRNAQGDGRASKRR